MADAGGSQLSSGQLDALCALEMQPYKGGEQQDKEGATNAD